jgi:hypothetical protein
MPLLWLKRVNVPCCGSCNFNYAVVPTNISE